MGVKKVRAKQLFRPPSAADQNVIAATADMYRHGPDRSPERQQPVDACRIYVKNNSGSSMRRGDVLYIDGTKLLTNIYLEQRWLRADKLTNSRRNKILVVLIDPLPNAKIGPAQIRGAGVCYVDVQETWHRRSYPASGADVLHSGLFGPIEILNTPTATGEQLCFVDIGHADNRGMFAKTTSSITAGSLSSGRLVLGSGTATIYDPYSTTAQYEDASHTATVYNMAGDPVDTGGYVFVLPTDDWLPLINIDPCTQPT